MTPLNDVTTRADPQEAWFWWICEKARGSSNLRGLSVEHAVAMSYELAALHITPDPVDELSLLVAEREAERETLPRRVRVVKAGYNNYWYANSIGQEFEVTGVCYLNDTPGYWVINPAEPNQTEHYVIDLADCEPVPCYDGGACRNESAVRALQARLKLAEDLVREFVLDLRVLTPQQREAWEKWTSKGAG